MPEGASAVFLRAGQAVEVDASPVTQRTRRPASARRDLDARSRRAERRTRRRASRRGRSGRRGEGGGGRRARPVRRGGKRGRRAGRERVPPPPPAPLPLLPAPRSTPAAPRHPHARHAPADDAGSDGTRLTDRAVVTSPRQVAPRVADHSRRIRGTNRAIPVQRTHVHQWIHRCL